ncbi:sterol carrier protein domain-containing protein [Nocardia sp. NPDC024068]|uniref:sterol carrier protein domain-containing protein n=1 Tax=Nocardia sp. NPDC024068 TaxID=3157197 RepID=UPI0033C08780
MVLTAAPDSPLGRLFTDERAVRVSEIRDETWLRLVGIPAAPARRAYRPGPAVAVAVTDTLLPANTGTYRIGAREVAASDAPADLTIDVAAPATAYLGGTPWRHPAHPVTGVLRRPGAGTTF